MGRPVSRYWPWPRRRESDESDAARRWRQQNAEVDATRRCRCGAEGTVRHASQAIDGRYVWWTCYAHRWWNGGPGGHVIESGGRHIPSEDYFRWYPLKVLPDDGTWLHLDGPLLDEPLPAGQP
jgi:hypothetical protein